MAATQQYTAPGVYLNETQAVTRQITAATTNWLAVLGVFPQGPTDEAVLVRSWSDFEAQFGGLTADSTLASYAVWQFFLNGGTGAWVVRLTSSEGTRANATLGGAVTVSSKIPGVSPNGWTAALVKSKQANAAATALDLTVTTADGKTTLEFLPALDGSSGTALAAAITSASSFLSAAPAGANPAAPVKADSEKLANATDADSPPMAQLGELFLSGKSPGTLMNGWNVALVPAGSGAAPAAGFANLTVTGKTPGGDPVSEAVTNLPTGNRNVLAQMISTRSNYVDAAPAPSVTVSAGTAKFANGTAAAQGVPAEPATAKVGALTLQARVPGTAQNGWTVTLTQNATVDTNLDFALTGPATTETFTNLPGDLQQLSLAISALSSNVTVPLTATLGSLVLGDKAAWGPQSLTDAILTELNADPNAGPEPPPVPRLDQIAPQHFNLMCMPDVSWLPLNNQEAIFTAAHGFCEKRQAFLIVDPPPPAAAGNVPGVLGGGLPGMTIDSIGTNYDQLQALLGPGWGANFLGEENIAGATYYPWVEIPDPANNFMSRPVPPSGTVAGVFARTDEARGVWKAPAGVEAGLRGVSGLADTTITDDINGDLNISGINCLRTFPAYDNVVWGGRTLAGADLYGTVFKYVPARRLSDFIEQSLQQSLKWAVFEPNEPALWSAITAQILPFMAGLYSAGAFTGATAAEAFSVACDATTTTAEDILRGVVNIQVQFQPAEPAEFVVLNVQIGALSAAAS